MRTRRAFFASALAALAAVFLSAPTVLRKIHRWDGRSWRRCRMMELRVGDVFVIDKEDGLYFQATEPPSLLPSGTARIVADGGMEVPDGVNPWPAFG